ncbi:hypothetical protein EGW08_003856 [Elysia chlorotica]|uniref:Carboxylic ester hydrolase n=1 Tax=Elysia chlorotica TaxID=188477 RepID=A0A433U3N9_ELYCH|nr:hypothetical protein EGW08_003856 [Elysia chlorotica]
MKNPFLKNVISTVATYLVFYTVLVASAPDVQLASGIARGYDRQASGTQKPYSVYYGIPFAEPPVGELRFAPPRPYLARGQGVVLTANRFRSSCYQTQILPTGELSEDCLHLNIFSPPDASPARLKKVMVWIHGGGFMNGGADQFIPGAMVTDRDVIVVTIQYRLAAFGFLSSMDEALPGNMGLKDQLLALRWVKDNIRQFGGDPDDVTIFGESAGSASVAALSVTPGANGLFTKVSLTIRANGLFTKVSLTPGANGLFSKVSLTPKANGLFSKAILQSGTILSSWVMAYDPKETFYQFAKHADCLPLIYNPWNTLNHHENVLKCLKTKTAEELVNALGLMNLLSQKCKGTWEQAAFGLVVDNDFLPKAPADLLRDRAYLQRNGVLDRSYLMGITDNEGILSVLGVPKEYYRNLTSASNMAPLIRSIVRGKLSMTVDSDALNVVDFIYSFPRDRSDQIPLQKFLELQTDDSFTVPLVLFARALVEAGPATPVYMYLFDSEPRLKDPNGPIRGTNHGMDLFHQFDEFSQEILDIFYFYADRDPVKFPIITNTFRGYVTDFAKTGSPSPGLSTSWPRYDRQREQYMVISSQPEVRERMFAQRVSLWTDFLPKMSAATFFGRNSGRPSFRG